MDPDQEDPPLRPFLVERAELFPVKYVRSWARRDLYPRRCRRD